MKESKALVHVSGGRVVLTSRDLADAFDKQHKNVIAAIEKELEHWKPAPALNGLKFKPVEIEPPFIKSSYIDAKGERRKMYELTQMGFLAIALGFEGDKAAQLRWTLLQDYERVKRELELTRKTDAYEQAIIAQQIYRDHRRQAMSAVKRLIDYAEHDFGAERIVIERGKANYYALIEKAINAAAGVPTGTRPSVDAETNVRLKDLERLVWKTIEHGIDKHRHYTLILRNALEGVTGYGKQYVSAEDRQRIIDFIDQGGIRQLKAAAEKTIAPQPDPDYDFEDDDNRVVYTFKEPYTFNPNDIFKATRRQQQ